MPYKPVSQCYVGFTLVELLIVIVVIGILSSFAIVGIGDSRARGRDVERTSDIDNLHSKLEEYHSDNGGYPNTFNATTFASLDPEALKDPNGNAIVINTQLSNQAVAIAAANPTATGANYVYIPYPSSCTAITCTGYVLKSYIERPNSAVPNPYIKRGLSNN